jgi:tRNA A-37 threonylcarbamoyl transferase component Bud32
VGLEVGAILEQRYEIVRAVNRGGMGAVYEAVDKRLANSKCAIKELLEDWQDSDNEQAKMIREKMELEMQFLVSLQHPGIPNIRDAFSVGKSYYLVMDFIEGQDLEGLLRDNKGPLAEEDVISYSIEVLEILEHLHTLDPPVLHRDIKPGNIIKESATGKLKLVDFGLARQATQSRAFTSVGTMGYLPIEQAGGSPDQRSDLYALAATMHCLVTGKEPTPFRISPILKVNPNVSPGLATLIDKCVDNEPDNRYESAAAMKGALKALAAGEVVELAPVSQVAEAPAQPRAPTSTTPEAVSQVQEPGVIGASTVTSGFHGTSRVQNPGVVQASSREQGEAAKHRRMVPKDICANCGYQLGRRDAGVCPKCGTEAVGSSVVFVPNLKEAARFLFSGHNHYITGSIGVVLFLLIRICFFALSKEQASAGWLVPIVLLVLPILGFGTHLIAEVVANRNDEESTSSGWPAPMENLKMGLLGVAGACVAQLPTLIFFIVAFSTISIIGLKFPPVAATIGLIFTMLTAVVFLIHLFLIPIEIANAAIKRRVPPLLDTRTTFRRQFRPAAGLYVSFLFEVIATTAVWWFVNYALNAASPVLSLLFMPVFDFALIWFGFYFYGVVFRDYLQE